jgi:hypothetical protein
MVNIDHDLAIEIGVVGYAKTISDAKKLKSRVGANPLLVKAIDVEGSFKANPVIKAEDAKKIKSLNLTKIFKNCSVAIVAD